MRDTFFGFYGPTAEEYDRLWKEGLIILDTNALLDLYRLPPKAREELFKALEYFQERLWIPYQVGLEFQRNRFSVISASRKKTSSTLAEAEKLMDGLKGKIQSLKLDQHDIEFDPTPVLKKLEAPIESLSTAIRKVQQAELDVSSTDPIRERIDRIFLGRIGKGPSTQDELATLCAGVDERFNSQIPPGFADDKAKDGRSFIHDHLTYHNKNGDLILWRQILAHVKETQSKNVMLITSDQKEDWWWKESGTKVIGPHQELMREIRREAGVDLFWMYTSDHFLQMSTNYSNQKVSQESVQELMNLDRHTKNDLYVFDEKTSETDPRRFQKNEFSWKIARLPQSWNDRLQTPFEADGRFSPVLDWLQSHRGALSQSPDSQCDVIAQVNGWRVGYQTKLARDSSEITDIVERFASYVNVPQSAYFEHFALIITVVDQRKIELTNWRAVQNALIEVLHGASPLVEVIVGTIGDDRSFDVLTRYATRGFGAFINPA